MVHGLKEFNRGERKTLRDPWGMTCYCKHGSILYYVNYQENTMSPNPKTHQILTTNSSVLSRRSPHKVSAVLFCQQDHILFFCLLFFLPSSLPSFLILSLSLLYFFLLLCPQVSNQQYKKTKNSGNYGELKTQAKGLFFVISFGDNCRFTSSNKK